MLLMFWLMIGAPGIGHKQVLADVDINFLTAFVNMLQASQERCRELETEAVVLTDELTRTSAVAARAAAREVVNGSKDEGVVPVTLHLEEVGLIMAV